MRTKTLLIAAAALAAGVISSQAQPVYSANIVGYVNQTAGKNFNAFSVPLDLAGGNTLTNIIQNIPDTNPTDPNYQGGIYDYTTVYIWNGSGYTIYTLDSGWPTGVGNAKDNAAVTPPIINPGTLYYFDNTTPNAYTNTSVGIVHADNAPTGSQIAGVTTNIFLANAYTFVSSKLPIAGGVTSVLGLTNTPDTNPADANYQGGTLDYTVLYIPNISVTGQFLGYNEVTIDSGWSTGFGNAKDNAQVAEPVIPVGGGFIFQNNLKPAQNIVWTQSL